MNSFIYLDSQNKTNGSNSNADFKLSLDLQKINSIALSSYEITYNVKNINSVNASSVFFETSSQSFPVDVVEGWYSFVDLATALQTALNVAAVVGTPFTVTYNAVTHKYTITNATFDFSLKNLNPGRTWLQMIDIEPDLPLSGSVTGGDNLNLNFTNKIYIVSDRLHQHKQVGDVSSESRINNILGVVYVTQNQPQQLDKADVNAPKSIFPKIISERIHNLKRIPQDRNRSIGDVDIKLLDDRGDIIPDDIEFSFEFITN